MFTFIFQPEANDPYEQIPLILHISKRILFIRLHLVRKHRHRACYSAFMTITASYTWHTAYILSPQLGRFPLDPLPTMTGKASLTSKGQTSQHFSEKIGEIARLT